MSLSGNENAPGSGSGGVQNGEELGMGRFGNDNGTTAHPTAPSFKPEQLDTFRGTGFELIPLNAWNASVSRSTPTRPCRQCRKGAT